MEVFGYRKIDEMLDALVQECAIDEAEITYNGKWALKHYFRLEYARNATRLTLIRVSCLCDLLLTLHIYQMAELYKATI